MRITLEYIDYKKELGTHKNHPSHELVVDLMLKNKWKPSQKRVDVDSDVSKEWMEASTRYVLEELTPNDRITLYTYSTWQYALINDFMQGGELYKKEFTNRKATDTDAKQLVMDALNAFKNEPDVKKLHKQWMKSESKKTNEAIIKEFETWLHAYPGGIPYAKIQENYNEIFFQQVSCYLPQLRILDIVTISQLRKTFLTITLSQWRQVLVTYVKDIKRIFKGAPPLPEPLTVYRGLRQRPKTSWSGLISTSLSKKVANYFINQTKKCCLQTIQLPKGAHVLPFFTVSAFAMTELEMLLQTYPKKTRKNKA